MQPNQYTNTQERRHSLQLIGLLLSPSWVSGLWTLVLAVSTTGLVIFDSHFQGSDFQRQFLNWKMQANANTATAADSLRQGSNQIVNYLELFIFWYAVGTVLYLLIMTVYHSWERAADTEARSHYVNMSQSAYQRAVYARFAVRFAGITGWVVYAFLTLKVFAPYLIAAIHVGDEQLWSPGAIGLIGAAAAGLFLMLHGHVVLLRLSLGRPRVFQSDEEYLLRTSHHL